MSVSWHASGGKFYVCVEGSSTMMQRVEGEVGLAASCMIHD